MGRPISGWGRETAPYTGGNPTTMAELGSLHGPGRLIFSYLSCAVAGAIPCRGCSRQGVRMQFVGVQLAPREEACAAHVRESFRSAAREMAAHIHAVVLTQDVHRRHDEAPCALACPSVGAVTTE